jgi:glycosyltransferase involved in cell wall biosynthesis
VRIGIDMLALQSPGSRGRGVGRFGKSLVSAMLAQGATHEYFLYAHDAYPIEGFPSSKNATLRVLTPEPRLGEITQRDALERLVRVNPDDLDVLLLLNPFELCPGYDPPARPLGRLRLAVVMHDLIPFLFQEHYLSDPPNAAWFYRRLNTLKGYDALLTNSDATRNDCVRMMDLPSDRVVTIGGASDGTYFKPDRSFPLPLPTRQAFHRLGIHRPFVFAVAGLDVRKNLLGLIDAFAMLPAELRRTHDLVLTCYLDEDGLQKVRNRAELRGLRDQVLTTGEVTDDELRILYQRCSAFAFPSLYEGLGLPLLEALHCGAAVLAGNNSSQIEVVGDAGLLVNVHDSGDIAEKLARILGDRALAQSLGERGMAQAKRFSWERSADRALEVLTRIVEPTRGRRRRVDRAHDAKPTVAVVSPWPPKGSGISDYAIRLIAELKKHYSLHLFHDSGYVPEIGLQSDELSCYDHRLFPHFASVFDYRGVIYQMGNSYYHGFLYDMMKRFPGVVALHDFNLAAFQFWRAHQGGVPMDNFRSEMEFCYPDRLDEIVPQLWDWTRERGGLQEACSRRGLHMNRSVLAMATAVVVHSPWCREEVGRTHPEYLHKINVVPMGATPRLASRELRAATRARFGLSPDALVFGSFGILAQGKMNVEAINAFQALAFELPAAVLIFVGQDWESGEAQRRAAECDLGDRIRFLGRQGDEDFLDLMAAIDIGIALRRPPTYGETSAALLDLLRTGVPTIINDVATFSGYPAPVVRKVRWAVDGLGGLVQAMRELAGDAEARGSLGQAAYDYVRIQHTWSRAADLYTEIIERLHGEREPIRRTSTRLNHATPSTALRGVQ